jgi:hypothetical protein
MKKLFLFAFISALSFSFTGCSDDDSSGSTSNASFVKFKIDGVQKKFTNVTFEEVEEEDGTYVYVTAMNGNNISEIVTFDFIKSDPENEDTIYGFTFDVAGITYENVGAGTSFSSVMEVNNNTEAKGVFTGTLKEWFGNSDEPVYKTFTDGSFRIKY